LKKEFDQTLASDNVHIIDPFTGTGTFITRLLQSGLIGKDDLPKKYSSQIHANEIVLLAYYIAAINIESVYHDIVGGEYQPFEGICLTDTFQLYEKEDLVDQILVQNSARRKKQKKLDIRVIIGNPPYSAGQSSGNDNNANIAYKTLDESIRKTYAARSTATLKNALYDSYIRAIRWASDRIGDSGVVGFVTNAGFLEANTADGLRKCLVDEFSSVYVFHLRGNQRTSGEQSRREGGKIFGSGSRAPIAITLLVKNPKAKKHGQIFWHDIGDYLSQQEKLNLIKEFKSIDGIGVADGWTSITPDEHGDWVRQRDNSFGDFISLGEKRDKTNITLFVEHSSGVKTNRDAWCYNASRLTLISNVSSMVEFYNSETKRFRTACEGLLKNQRPDPEIFVKKDTTKISWTREVYADVGKGKLREFIATDIFPSLYRPYTKQWMYFNRNFNNCVYQMPRIFPDASVENRVIMVKQRWAGHGQLALMVDRVVELQTDGGTQCFPLYLYESADEVPPDSSNQEDMFARAVSIGELPISPQYKRKDGISDVGLAHFQSGYPTETIGKEDLFYYVYGLLHSPDYRERYADNLAKELPRIPCVKTAADFWAYSHAGRNLAALHLDYESVPRHPVEYEGGSLLMAGLDDADYRVTQMKFASKADKSRVVYNHKITMIDVPLEAYEYVVNGKSALEWVMERQAVTTHKDSGIVNDANLWATETMSNARYPLELFQRVITVSLETMKIVRALPRLAA
jgi:predicted helicase